MDPYWNKLHLEHPPNLTCRLKKHEINVDILISNIVTAIQDLQCQNFLHADAAILSRMIYRMKCKFRTNKSFRKMEQVKRALLNYLSLGLDKEYKNLKKSIEKDGNFVILPSKQMLEYVLVRTIGFAKLMIRVKEVVESAALLLKERINAGQSWAIAVVVYAVISRLWILSKYLIKKSCSWYADLHCYLKVFESVSVPWLPEDQTLPSNLETWLDISWIKEEISNPSTTDESSTSMFKLLKPTSNVEKDLVIHLAKHSESCKDILISSMTNNKNSYENIDDIGEQIERRILKKDSLEDETQESCTPSNDISPDYADRKEDVCKFDTPKTTRLNKSSIKIIHSLLKKHNRQGKTKEFKNLDEMTTNNEINSSIFNKVEVQDSIPSRKRKRTTRPDSQSKKGHSTFISLDTVKTKSDLIKCLNQDSYQGLDKLKWNITKNQGRKFLNRMEECSNPKKQNQLLKKTIKHLERLIE